MLNWSGLISVLVLVTMVLAIYLLITRSAGVYTSSRQFWLTALLSAGISYLVSGGLFLFLHLSVTVAVAVSAVVPFLVGNLDLGGAAGKEPAPSDEGLNLGEAPAEGEGDEEEARDDEGEDKPVSAAQEADAEASGWDEAVVNSPGQTNPLWN